MIGFFKEILGFKDPAGEAEFTGKDESKIEVATAALFLEIAKSDSNLDDEEKKLIADKISSIFGHEKAEVELIIELAEKRILKSVSLYEFTEIVNRHFDQNEKYELVKHLWAIIYSDKKLNKYEEYFLKVIARNLKISDRNIIAAKMEAKKSPA